MEDQEIKKILTEIRDSQQALAAEYKRVANEALSLQQEAFELQKQSIATQQKSVEQQTLAVDRQARFGKLYHVVLILSAILVAFLVIWLMRLPI